MALPNLRSFNFLVQLGLLSQGDAVNFQEPNTTQIGELLETVVKIPNTTTGYSVNLATLFPAITSVAAICVLEFSSPGVNLKVSPNSTGTRSQLRAGTPYAYGTSGAPPTLYFDNAGAQDAFVKIIVAGS